ncbi:MAG: hypothetical protein WBW94_16335 [Anaerolineales bacterium]
MNSKSNSSTIWWFIGKILMLEIAMIGVADLLSYYMLNFATILFLFGILIGAIGALRGGPASIDTIHTNMILQHWHQPMRQSVDQRTYIIEHSVSTYSFENVMALAGLIAIVISMILIVSSK